MMMMITKIVRHYVQTVKNIFKCMLVDNPKTTESVGNEMLSVYQSQEKVLVCKHLAH